MLEEAYVLLETNEAEKRIEVVRQSFAFGSEEAKKAKQNQKALFDLARTHDYKVYCNGTLVLEPTIDRKKAKYHKLKEDLEELSKKWDERDKRLAEIKQKDLLELTEEEIVLLAESRVHGIHFTINGRPALGTPTTFEGEYEKIKMAIERRKSGNRSMH